MKVLFNTAFILIFIISSPLFAQYPLIEESDIFRDENFRELQQDIERLSPLLMRWEQGHRSDEMAENLLMNLKFFLYEVSEGESLYTIAADLMVNGDTISSLNGISHPLFLEAGTLLVIPNISGIYRAVIARNGLDNHLLNSQRAYGLPLKIGVNGHEYLDFLFFPAQRFTPSERLYFTDRPFVSPLNNFIMGSPYGMRSDPFSSHWTLHSGIDLNVPNGRDVFSIGSGIVKSTGVLENYGIYIIIEHEGGYESLYGHLDRILIQQGDRILAGQVIAHSGNTGRSTGPHLHLEVRKNGQSLDPAGLIRVP